MDSLLGSFQLVSGKGKYLISQFSSTKENLLDQSSKECDKYLEELIDQSYYKIVKNVPKILDVIEVVKDGKFYKRKRFGARLSFRLIADVSKRDNCCFYGFNYKTFKDGKYVLESSVMGE